MRAAVLTRSPTTMPSSTLSMATACPVTTPTRAASPSSWWASPKAWTASTSSRLARTARSASFSRAIGTPQTAITASPMNFSIVPPCRPMMARASSK